VNMLQEAAPGKFKAFKEVTMYTVDFGVRR
jgi:hypothetical protein